MLYVSICSTFWIDFSRSAFSCSHYIWVAEEHQYVQIFESQQEQSTCVINLHMWESWVFQRNENAQYIWTENGMTRVPSSPKAWRCVMFSMGKTDLGTLTVGDPISSMPPSSLFLLEAAPVKLSLLVSLKISCMCLSDAFNLLMESGFKSLTFSHILGTDSDVDIFFPSGSCSVNVSRSSMILILMTWAKATRATGSCRLSSDGHGLVWSSPPVTGVDIMNGLNKWRYTKHVSIYLLDSVSGKEVLHPFILGRTED